LGFKKKKGVSSTNFSKISMLEKNTPNFVYHKMGRNKRKRRIENPDWGG
jgi:hypothetical protein